MTRTLRIRILLAVLAVLVILGGLAAASPYLINTRVVKKQISNQISDWMGLPVRVRGEPVVTVFPYITVKLKDVEVSSKLGTDQPSLVRMNNLRAELYWLPLILGNFEVRRFSLVDPEFELVRSADGIASWDMTGGSLFSPDQEDGRLTLSNVTLGSFQIINGKARYRDEAKGVDEQFDDINVEFDWPSTSDTAFVDGGLIWRGQDVDVTARSDKPIELFAGSLSPLTLEVSSPLFTARLDGSAATMANLQLEGDFAFETSSLRDVLAWLDISLSMKGGLGPATLQARSNLVGASVSFSDMALMLDNNKADGVLQLDFRRDRPLIQGTLASDVLDLGPYLVSASQSANLLDKSFAHYDLSRADIDIRLSANSLKFAPVELGRTAATLVTRDEQISLSISEAFAYGGRLETSLDMRPQADNPGYMNGHLRAKANGLLAGTVVQEIGGSEMVTGTALAELDLQGAGPNLREAAEQAQGDVSLVLTDGRLSGLSLDELQKTLEEDGPADPSKLFSGSIEFDVLSVRGRMADQAMIMDGIRLTSGNRALLGTAGMSLSDQIFDFPGILALYRSADPASHSSEAPIKELPFRLMGSFGDLQLLPRNKNDVETAQEGPILAPGVPVDLEPADTSEGNQAAPDQSETVTQTLEPVVTAIDAAEQSPLKAVVNSEGTVSEAQDGSTLKTLGEAAEEILQQVNPFSKEPTAPAAQ